MAQPSSPSTSTPVPLKLLSLDGGGIRGLSSLYILQYLMKRVNPEDPPKPCDYFDLIGGTSTGGLIAIMLGRLQMNVDDCIKTYIQLSSAAFQPKRQWYDLLGSSIDFFKAGGVYSSKSLESEIRNIVRSQIGHADAKLMNPDAPCKSFVCASTKTLNEPVLFRTYTTAKAVDTLGISNCTIWQAGRATSAAPTFFDPIKIGHQLFIDGATGRNNPVEEVLAQAKLIWSDAEHRIQCIISIGTGVPDLKDFGDNLKKVIDTLKDIATETEATERRFSRDHEYLGVGGRYFRYNVQQGLENVGLDEYREVPRIQVATKHYLELPQMEFDINAFVNARVPDFLPPLTLESRNNHLSWLQVVDPLNYHNDSLSKKTPSTGEWCLRKYSDMWETESQSFLWLQGQAGCGKTVLSSTIIDNIECKSLGVLAYFYISFRDKETQNLRNLIKSLLKQLARGLERKDPHLPERYHLPKAFRELHDKFQHAGEPKDEDLKTAIQRVLSESAQESKKVYLVIDALDECPVGNDRVRIMKFLAELSAATQGHTHIVITSRPDEDVKNAIRGNAIRLVDIDNSLVDNDIRTHIKTRMNEDVTFKEWAPGQQQKVTQRLTEKADGVFRWVHCQLDALQKLHRDKDIDMVLDDLPKDLDETYSRMLLQIPERTRRDAHLVLQWLSSSQRPLKLREAEEAVVFTRENPSAHDCPVDPTRRFPKLMDAANLLSGLVTISSMDDQKFGAGQDRTISFAHFSAKQYLECERAIPAEFRLPPEVVDSHWAILKNCLDYIHYYESRLSGEPDPKGYHLLLYVCKYWPQHAMGSYTSRGEEFVQELTTLLTKNPGPILTLSMRVALGHKSIASHETLQSIMRSRLNAQGCGKSSLGFDLESDFALHLATIVCEETLVKLLLDCGIDVDRDFVFRVTALHLAARGGYESVVNLLVQKGANIEAKDYYNATPLAWAIENGSIAVIELLLNNGAEVNYHYRHK
ncbi:hypothetical protein Egran_03325, partial [Elaphomyces granulatus]